MKKKGKKKKIQLLKKKKILSDGSIIFATYENNRKGIISKSNKFFRNALTIIMFVNKKKLNIKISNTGNLQITGCKTIKQSIDATIEIFKIIKNSNLIHYKNEKDKEFSFMIIPTMCNLDFS